MRILEELFVITRVIDFERHNFICRKQKKMRRFSYFMRIWSNWLLGLFVESEKMNGFLIFLRPTCPTKTLQKNCRQKPDHHKMHTIMQSGERKGYNIVKRRKQTHLKLKQPRTQQWNKNRWATFNHAGEVVIKTKRTKTAKEVGEICEVETIFPRNLQSKGATKLTNKSKRNLLLFWQIIWIKQFDVMPSERQRLY